MAPQGHRTGTARPQASVKLTDPMTANGAANLQQRGLCYPHRSMEGSRGLWGRTVSPRRVGLEKDRRLREQWAQLCCVEAAGSGVPLMGFTTGARTRRSTGKSPAQQIGGADDPPRETAGCCCSRVAKLPEAPLPGHHSAKGVGFRLQVQCDGHSRWHYCFYMAFELRWQVLRKTSVGCSRNAMDFSAARPLPLQLLWLHKTLQQHRPYTGWTSTQMLQQLHSEQPAWLTCTGYCWILGSGRGPPADASRFAGALPAHCILDAGDVTPAPATVLHLCVHCKVQP